MPIPTVSFNCSNILRKFVVLCDFSNVILQLSIMIRNYCISLFLGLNSILVNNYS